MKLFSETKEITVSRSDLISAIKNESNINLADGSVLKFIDKSKSRADFELLAQNETHYFYIDLQLFGKNGHVKNRENKNLLVKDNQDSNFFQNDVLLLEIDYNKNGIWQEMSLSYQFPLDCVKVTPYVDKFELVAVNVCFFEHFKSFGMNVTYKKPNKNGEMVLANTFFLIPIKESDADYNCMTFIETLAANTKWDTINIASEDSKKPLNIRFLKTSNYSVVPHGFDFQRAIDLAIDKNSPADYKNHMSFIFICALNGCLERKYGKQMKISGFNVCL